MSNDRLGPQRKQWTRLVKPMPAQVLPIGIIADEKSWMQVQSDLFERRHQTAQSIRAQYDGREHGLIGTATDQLTAASCISHAACAVADARRRLVGLGSIPLSPNYLHCCLLRLESDLGTRADWLAERVKKEGVPRSVDGEQNLEAPEQCPGLGKAGRFAVSHFYRFETEREVKQEILLHGPVIAHMYLFDDFWRKYGGGIYYAPKKKSAYQHAVALIGFDDKQGCWIGKNSRGNGWGENGCFKIAYGECGILSDGLPVYSFDMKPEI
ncbi:MAG: C1 family peptidase [Pseudomonas sp.]